MFEKYRPLLFITLVITLGSCYNYDGPMRPKIAPPKLPEAYVITPPAALNAQEYLQKMAKDIKRGIPSAQVQLLQDSIKVLFPDNISYNQSSILPLENVNLEMKKLAGLINKYEKTNVLVTGHTDNSGEEQNNKRISEMRAQYILDLLLSYQAPKERMSSWGLGSSSPISSNNVDGGRDNNRRVEFVVLSTISDEEEL